ncbi:protein FAR1-related sequence 5-like [Senna tora]|uniref:Protein FAR1-related sequence 5-like n=1 Tax=Senna tora TaxID=362788 RepID=A0A834WYV4_9FABA|nr:protein FAR1-related sequence 5-like [Senna tora]
MSSKGTFKSALTNTLFPFKSAAVKSPTLFFAIETTPLTPLPDAPTDRTLEATWSANRGSAAVNPRRRRPPARRRREEEEEMGDTTSDARVVEEEFEEAELVDGRRERVESAFAEAMMEDVDEENKGNDWVLYWDFQITLIVEERLLNPSHRRSYLPPSLNVAAAPPTAGHQRRCTYRTSFIVSHRHRSSNLLDNKISAEPSFENEVTESDLTPYVGMEFETEEHAYRFYNAYADFIGFSVRKHWTNKSRVDQITILSQKFVCFKEGFKKKRDCEAKRVHKDIRTGCLAQMIVGQQSNEKYVVTYFEKQHNHALATPRSRHKLPSQRKISAAQATQIELAN